MARLNFEEKYFTEFTFVNQSSIFELKKEKKHEIDQI